MSTTMELQLNENVKGYIRIPYTAFKTPLLGNGSRSMRRAELSLFGYISSFATATEACNMPYRRFEEKLRLSRGTVARGISTLKNAEIIYQDKSRRSGAAYSCAAPQRSGIKIELYLYHTKFNVRGELKPRYLTQSEINVLCLMKTHCSNPKGDGLFRGSVRGISKTLNLSKTTVQKAIDVLMHAELIFRTDKNKGLNGHKRSAFTVNEKLLRRAEKNYKQASQAQDEPKKPNTLSEYERAADARAERERYYSNLRDFAWARVEAFQTRLDTDVTYKRVNSLCRAVEPKIERAKLYSLPDLALLLSDQKRLQGERAKRMAELGIYETDLQPIWKCSKCSDSGYLPNGRMCGCYPQGGAQ